LDDADKSLVLEGSRRVFNHDAECIVEFIIVLVEVHCFTPELEAFTDAQQF
jgi:hypothetical protein